MKKKIYTEDSVYRKEETDELIVQVVAEAQIDDSDTTTTTKSWSSDKTSKELSKALLLHEILYHFFIFNLI